MGKKKPFSIVLNGLAILDPDQPPPTLWPGPAQRAPLDEYYRDAVIGGPGCFLVVAEGFEAFGPALRRKLEAHGPRIVHTSRGLGYTLRASDATEADPAGAAP